jgi:preprotein translocase subunit SecD
MTPTARKVGLLALLGVGGVGLTSSLAYLWGRPPDISQVGGTVLVYQVEEGSNPPPGDRLEALPDALRHRLDPSGVLGITVRLVGAGQVEIAIPRSGDHEKAVRMTRDLVKQAGVLEFRVVANEKDDAEGLRAAQDYLKDPRNARELAKRAGRGQPPPPLPAAGQPAFTVRLGDQTTKATYRWVELGKAEVSALHLTSAQLARDAARSRQVEAHRDREAFDWQAGTSFQVLLYCRSISNPDRVSPEDRKRGKRYEYFILVRNPERGQEVNGSDLANVRPGQYENGNLAIFFRLSKDGGERFYQLTSRNAPSGNFLRHLAIILDGQVVSAPALRSAIRRDGQITGQFTDREVDNLVTILRAGALPVRLKPVPVSESTIQPKGP